MQNLNEKYQVWLNSQEWIFAKTYAKTCPHEYIVKYKTEDKEMFIEFITFIRNEGYAEKWKDGVIRKYYNIGGFKYWTMGDPINDTIVLNRVKI